MCDWSSFVLNKSHSISALAMSETRALFFCRVLGRNRAVRRWRPAERPQFCYSSLFSYVGATRPAFALKPQAAALKAHGAEIIVIDSQFSCMEQIQELLKGVGTGTGMSTLNYNQLELQCPQFMPQSPSLQEWNGFTGWFCVALHSRCQNHHDQVSLMNASSVFP